MKMKVLFCLFCGLNSAFIFADENKYLNNNAGGWFFKKDTTFDNVGKNKKEQEPQQEVGVRIDNGTIEVHVPNEEPTNELERQSNTQYEPPPEQQESEYVIETKPSKKVPTVPLSKKRSEMIDNEQSKPKYDIQLK